MVLGGAALAVAGAIGACAGGVSEAKPVASLGSSPSSSAAFEAIRQAWRDPDGPGEMSADALEPMLSGFLARFPDDGRVPFARALLALVAMQKGDLSTADRQIALCTNVPPGSVRDLVTVARARRVRLGGDAEAALDLLRSLVGKTVDQIVRTAFEEELTLSALATHREYEAISYMDAWLRASPEDEKERTVALVQGFVEKLPEGVLFGALQAMRAERARYGYGVDIERILAARLVGIATASGNAQLARALLDPDAGMTAVVGAIEGDAGGELGELATSRRGLNSVEGRTIGLLLPTDSPALRDESARVLRGIMWALGLPPGVRSAATGPPKRDSGYADGGSAGGGEYLCAPPEPAPAMDEPSPGDSIRLVTRDDAGSSDRTEVSLDELAGEGAAIVIAGLDPRASTRALRWGENHGVAVMVLAPPESGEAVGDFGFVVGADRQASLDALVRAAPSLARVPVAPVIDASEVAGSVAAQRAGALNFLAPVSCDAPVARAGDARFPLAAWQAEKARAWTVSGSPACAQGLVEELSAARLWMPERPIVALTLEAATLLPHPAGVRVVTASAGLVPTLAAGDDDEVRRFAAVLGDVAVTYWVSLGRDAGALARAAVMRLPKGTVTEPRSVAARRLEARMALSTAKVRLWSSESAGWSDGADEDAGGHAFKRLKRTLCAIDREAR